MVSSWFGCGEKIVKGLCLKSWVSVTDLTYATILIPFLRCDTCIASSIRRADVPQSFAAEPNQIFRPSPPTVPPPSATPNSQKPTKSTAPGARRKQSIRLIIQRAEGIRIAAVHTPPGTGDVLLRSVLGAAAASGDAEVARQRARLEDDARTAALGFASLAYAEGAPGVARVADVEGHLGGVAVPGALAEAVVLEAAARGPGAVHEVRVQRFAAASVVFWLVRHLALDADGSQAVDGGAGGGLRVALVEEGAGAAVAPVRTRGHAGQVVAARVEGVVGQVWVERGGWRALPR